MSEVTDYSVVADILKRYPRERTWLLPVIWDVVESLGWLNSDRTQWIANGLNVPYAEVYGVASFYSLFSWESVAAPGILVCTDVMCAMKSGETLYEEIAQAAEETGQFSVQATTCLGRCDSAPACLIDYEVVPFATSSRVLDLVRGWGGVNGQKAGDHD